MVLPPDALALLGALAAGHGGGWLLGRRDWRDVERHLWLATAVGLAAARLAYVLEWHEAYAAQPLSILDIRDGGWNAAAGFAAATLHALIAGFRLRRAARGLAGALGAALAAWAIASLALSDAGEARVPGLEVQTLQGATLALSGLAGRPLVVSFWATWCPPCRREMPVLAAAQREHPEVAFVFANQGESPGTVRRYLAAEGLALEGVVLDPALALGKAAGVRGMPTTLFYDSRGRLVESRVGELSPATLAERLARVR